VPADSCNKMLLTALQRSFDRESHNDERCIIFLPRAMPQN